MPADDGLTPEEIAERVERARSLIQEVRDDAPIPVVAHAAHQADMYCHRIMWEVAAESGSTPELEAPVEREEGH